MESGTHTELLNRGGKYAEMWQKQLEAEPTLALTEESGERGESVA